MINSNLQALHDLFLSLFSRDELHAFVASLPKGSRMLSEARVSCSLVDTVTDITIALARNDLINDDLFKSLRRIRPGRARDIENVQRVLMLRSKQSLQEETQPDFFLSYAHTDKRAANELYALLVPHASVFLDSKSLSLGDSWDSNIMQAIEAARIVVVIVSPHTQGSFYQREEITRAIELAHQDPSVHRLVPVFIGSSMRDAADIPYDLRSVNGVVVDTPADLQVAAKRLLKVLEGLKGH